MSSQEQPPTAADGADRALGDLRSRLDALQESVSRLGAQPDAAAPAAAGGLPIAPPVSPPAPPAPAEYQPAPAYAPPVQSQPPAPASPPAPAPAPVAGGVVLLDAGPFEDLVDLRYFEDALGSLAATRDVQTRRVAHGRARIQIGLAGNYALDHELRRLGRPLQTGTGPEGELIVDFTDVEQPAPTEADKAAYEREEQA